jgi:hypothetical protein
MNQVESLTVNTDGPVDKPLTTKIHRSSSSRLRSFFKMPHGTLKTHARSGSDSTALTAVSDISDYLFGEEEEEEHYVHTTKDVSFDKYASARHTLNRQDISTKEKRDAWFCKAEFDHIARQRSKQILKLERGDILKDIKYCARGLESYTHHAAKLKRRIRQAAYVAVLDGPATHCHGDFHDHDVDEHIALRYHGISSRCQLRASEVGLRDQSAATEHLDDILDG